MKLEYLSISNLLDMVTTYLDEILISKLEFMAPLSLDFFLPSLHPNCICIAMKSLFQNSILRIHFKSSLCEETNMPDRRQTF